MSELAAVTELTPRGERAEPSLDDDRVRADYWERMQALRVELTRLQGAAGLPGSAR